MIRHRPAAPCGYQRRDGHTPGRTGGALGDAHRRRARGRRRCCAPGACWPGPTRCSTSTRQTARRWCARPPGLPDWARRRARGRAGGSAPGRRRARSGRARCSAHLARRHARALARMRSSVPAHRAPRCPRRGQWDRGGAPAAVAANAVQIASACCSSGAAAPSAPSTRARHDDGPARFPSSVPAAAGIGGGAGGGRLCARRADGLDDDGVPLRTAILGYTEARRGARCVQARVDNLCSRPRSRTWMPSGFVDEDKLTRAHRGGTGRRGHVPAGARPRS